MISSKREAWGYLLLNLAWDGKPNQPESITMPASVASKVTSELQKLLNGTSDNIMRSSLTQSLKAIPWSKM